MKRTIKFLSLLVRTFVQWNRAWIVGGFNRDPVMASCVYCIVSTIIFLASRCYVPHHEARNLIFMIISLAPLIIMSICGLGWLIYRILRYFAEQLEEVVTSVVKVSSNYWQQAGEKTELEDKEILLRSSDDDGNQLLRMAKGDN